MEIKKIGIVGAGVMGCQIAELFLKHNFDVVLFSRTNESIKTCVQRFRGSELTEKLKTTINLGDLKGSDMLIECVKEDKKTKQEMFKKLDMLAESVTIIASNTSSITIKEIAKDCKNKSNIIGIHFFNPVNYMKLVEIAKPDFTSEETCDNVVQLIKNIGKEPVIVKDTPGFLLNRMLFLMLNEAANILHEGTAAKDDIDKVMVLGASHPIGPLKIMDLVGIDVTISILKNLQKGLKDDKFKPSQLLLQMIKENKLGRKTKKGFYEY